MKDEVADLAVPTEVARGREESRSLPEWQSCRHGYVHEIVAVDASVMPPPATVPACMVTD